MQSTQKPLGSLQEAREAILVLRKFVKESAIEGQKHLCKSLVNAQDWPAFDHAMALVALAIKNGELTREDFLRQVGLG